MLMLKLSGSAKGVPRIIMRFGGAKPVPYPSFAKSIVNGTVLIF